ncbi:efflux RND transporter periplasmic adaptor subunit [Gemmatimonadota bacterium]
MKMKNLILLVFPLAFLLIASCGSDPQSDTPGEIPAEEAALEEEANDHELHVEPEQIEEWGIVAGGVSTTDLVSAVDLPGVIELNQNRTAQISSYVDGKVLSLAVDLGSRVRRGQILLTVNSPAFSSAQAAYLEAFANYRFSSGEHDRAVELFREKAIEEREYLRRISTHELAVADLAAAESILHSFGIYHDWIDQLVDRYTEIDINDGEAHSLAESALPILSPVDGIVISRDVVVGENVDPAKVLFTVSDLNTVWAHLDAYEIDLPFIDYDSKVTITTPLFPEQTFSGTITHISDVVDATLRTVHLRVELPNRERLLRPNLFIRGLVHNYDPEARQIAIPEEAITMYHGEKTVFVAADAHAHGDEMELSAHGEDHVVFEVRHIELGALIGNMRIITGGLQEGEVIAVKGAFTLKAELEKGSVGDAHVH